MKKTDFFFIIIDVLIAIDAIIDICAGVGTAWDIMVFCFVVILLAVFIIRRICEEIRIQKKLKQMREEETQKKMQGETKNGH